MGAPVTRLGGQQAEMQDLENTIKSLESIIEEKDNLIKNYETVSPKQQREHIALLTEENKRLIAENASMKTEVKLIEKNAKLLIENARHEAKLSDNSKKTAWTEVKNKNSELKELDGTIVKQEQALEKKDTTITKQVDIIEKKDIKIEGLEQAIENIKETLRVVTESKIILEGQVESYKQQIEKQDKALEMLRDLLEKVEGLNMFNGLTEDEVKGLVDILNKNKNYLINSTVGKGVVRDSSKAKDKVEMVIEVLNNDGKATAEMATKYGYKNTSGVINYVDRLKDSWSVVIKDYISNGNKVTDEMMKAYESNYADILSILSER